MGPKGDRRYPEERESKSISPDPNPERLVDSKLSSDSAKALAFG
jgi:hypothetical protein